MKKKDKKIKLRNRNKDNKVFIKNKNKDNKVSIINRNKKGMEGLFLNIFIGVICFVILMFAATAIYGFFSDESNLQKAESNLKLVKTGLDMAKENPDGVYAPGGLSGQGFAEVYSPTDWMIVAFPYGDTIEKPYLCKGSPYCICICSKSTGDFSSWISTCNSLGKCINSEEKIITINSRGKDYDPPWYIEGYYMTKGALGGSLPLNSEGLPIPISKPLPIMLNITYDKTNGYEVIAVK